MARPQFPRSVRAVRQHRVQRLRAGRHRQRGSMLPKWHSMQLTASREQPALPHPGPGRPRGLGRPPGPGHKPRRVPWRASGCPGLERAIPIPRDIDAHLAAAFGQHRLGPGAVTDVSGLVTSQLVPVRAQVLVQRRFQHCLGELLEQPSGPRPGMGRMPAVLECQGSASGVRERLAFPAGRLGAWCDVRAERSAGTGVREPPLAVARDGGGGAGPARRSAWRAAGGDRGCRQGRGSGGAPMVRTTCPAGGPSPVSPGGLAR